LQTYLTDDNGFSVGAYYIYVTRSLESRREVITDSGDKSLQRL
jgi:hypothetical protein